MMTPTDIDCILTEASEAACDIRRSIVHQIERSEMLDRFWRLQDTLNRLLEAVSDHGDQVLPSIRQRHADLAVRITDLLGAVSTSKTDRVAAIASSCSAINHYLLRIESACSQTPGPVLAHAASAGH